MNNVVPAIGYIPDPPDDGDDRFARAFKDWREWNVAVNFLANLHFGADESQVFVVKDDPPDVIFHDACFEIKEIMDPGRRRHDEVKAAQLNEKTVQERAALAMYSSKDLTPEEVGNLVLTELHRLNQKRYLFNGREDIDLLFYVNKLEHWFKDGPMPPSQLFESFQWRSVSAVVDTSQSLVFFAQSNAPKFLIDNVGVIRKRWEPLDDENIEN